MTSRRGVTLLELMASIVVMSIIASVIMPVIMSATDAYASARLLRSSTESLAYASDQLQRAVRKAPSGADGTQIGISTGTATRVLFLDGTGFELSGSDLNLLVPGGDPVPVCRDVGQFSIRYIGADGSTNVIADPSTAHRIGFTITKDGSMISALAFPRVWIGQE